MNGILHIENMTVCYGKLPAVRELTLSVSQLQWVCLIGANGAGKTTTLKAIAGLLPFTAKQARLLDVSPLQNAPAHERVRCGLSLVPEGRGLFTKLTVQENLDLGAYPLVRQGKTGKSNAAKQFDLVLDLFPKIKERLRQTAGTLSGGEQQMVAIGRALMSQPKLLMLDEPSMGLAPMMVEKVFEAIAKLHKQGLSILMVEQNAHMALQFADWACVLEAGTLSLQGPAKTLKDDPKVQEAYLGKNTLASVATA